jgi:hypothetical protein
MRGTRTFGVGADRSIFDRAQALRSVETETATGEQSPSLPL